jgi:hypothetical protein
VLQLLDVSPRDGKPDFLFILNWQKKINKENITPECAPRGCQLRAHNNNEETWSW